MRHTRLPTIVLAVAFVCLRLSTAHAQSIGHTVQPGENLYRIGLRYGIDYRLIMSANGLASTNIHVGQRLVMPCTGAVPSAVVPAPAPNPPPVPPAPPAQSRLLPVSGRPQSLPLDCESRSAVDLAAYLGVPINELEFFRRLPVSDDPDAGFVGNVYGTWGQLPPGPYGVHAEPIAAVLRQYGLNAHAMRGLTWESVRAEIDAGRPVIAWVVGHVTNGTPVTYTASNGHTTVAARYEHTVIVIGYSNGGVTVLDGAAVYTRATAQFLQSWAVMGNMVVLVQP